MEKCEAPGAGKVDTIAVVRGTDISDVEARSEAKLYVPTRTAYIVRAPWIFLRPPAILEPIPQSPTSGSLANLRAEPGSSPQSRAQMPHAQDETFVSLTPTMVDSDHKRRVSAASTTNASTTNRDSESFQRSSSDSKRILDEEDEDRDRDSPSPIDNIRPVPTREQTVDPRWLPTYIPPDHPRRTLVVCLDGTGDQFDADNSNIVRFFSMLKKDDKEKQMVYYQVRATYSCSLRTMLTACSQALERTHRRKS